LHRHRKVSRLTTQFYLSIEEPRVLTRDANKFLQTLRRYDFRIRNIIKSNKLIVPALLLAKSRRWE